jgi:hypothetical protein
MVNDEQASSQGKDEGIHTRAKNGYIVKLMNIISGQKGVVYVYNMSTCGRCRIEPEARRLKSENTQ